MLDHIESTIAVGEAALAEGQTPYAGGLLAKQIIRLSNTGQPCDITFHDRGPVCDVKIDQRIGRAFMNGAGRAKLNELFENILLSNGESVRLDEIWVIVAMPFQGVSASDLEKVDISEGDKQASPNGDTIRKMIRDRYHCKTAEEEDYFLRRFLAA